MRASASNEWKRAKSLRLHEGGTRCHRRRWMRSVAEVSSWSWGDDLLDRAAGQELHQDEVDQQDAKERRHHQDQAAEGVGAHLRVARLRPSACRTWPGRTTRRRRRGHRAAAVGTAEDVPGGDPVAGLGPVRHRDLHPAQHPVEGADPDGGSSRVLEATIFSISASTTGLPRRTSSACRGCRRRPSRRARGARSRG